MLYIVWKKEQPRLDFGPPKLVQEIMGSFHTLESAKQFREKLARTYSTCHASPGYYIESRRLGQQ